MLFYKQFLSNDTKFGFLWICSRFELNLQEYDMEQEDNNNPEAYCSLGLPYTKITRNAIGELSVKYQLTTHHFNKEWCQSFTG